MSRYAIFKTASGVLLVSAAFICAFSAGIGTGFHFYPEMFLADHDDHDDPDHDEDEYHEHDDHEPHEDEDHVALTEQAFLNLNLQLGTVRTGEFWKSTLVPAEVVEIPGRSNVTVSSPVTGVVETIHIVPGQAIDSKAKLFEIRITDQALTDAQSTLLSNLATASVTQTEIERIEPLTKTGIIQGKRLLQLKYELSKLDAQRRTLIQELRGRGLPETVVNSILTSQTMASTIVIQAPEFEPISADSVSTTGYSIERLHPDPGQTVTVGDDLCSLAFHSELYIQGTAFEGDLSTLNQIADQNWTITAERSQVEDYVDHEYTEGLKLLRVDNHVDNDTQTVRFYVGLTNTVDRVRHGNNGIRFEQWRYRPGQRMHLRLPVEKWTNQITLPAEAVVIEGPNVFVFAEHHHDHDEDEHDNHDTAEMTTPGDIQLASATALHTEDSDDSADVGTGDDHHDDEHHEHDVFIELEPVPVRLLHRDDRTVVIADDGQIHDDDRIAMNHAYKLYLAMKMQADGGGGHDHHH